MSASPSSPCKRHSNTFLRKCCADLFCRPAAFCYRLGTNCRLPGRVRASGYMPGRTDRSSRCRMLKTEVGLVHLPGFFQRFAVLLVFPLLTLNLPLGSRLRV